MQLRVSSVFHLSAEQEYNPLADINSSKWLHKFLTGCHIFWKPKHCLGAPFCILKEALSWEHVNPQNEKKGYTNCKQDTICNEKTQANSIFSLIFHSISWCLKDEQEAVKIHHSHDFMFQPQVNTLHSAWNHLSGLRIHWWVWGLRQGL